MMDNPVDGHLTIACECFTLDPERIGRVVEMSRDFDADGVIHQATSSCIPYMVEA